MRIDEVSFDSDRIARYNPVSRISTSELACAMDQMLKDRVSLDRGMYLCQAPFPVSVTIYETPTALSAGSPRIPEAHPHPTLTRPSLEISLGLQFVGRHMTRSATLSSDKNTSVI
jgi:hypothetical protein